MSRRVKQHRADKVDGRMTAAAWERIRPAAMTRVQARALVAASEVDLNDRRPTGRCHTCDRAISGARIFCGPCLVKRGNT